jgi:hypothetical protein
VGQFSRRAKVFSGDRVPNSVRFAAAYRSGMDSYKVVPIGWKALA